MKDRAGRCQWDGPLNPHQQALVHGQWTVAGVAPRVSFCLSHGHALSFSHTSGMYLKPTLSNPPWALSLNHPGTRLATRPTGELPAALTAAACLSAQSELKPVELCTILYWNPLELRFGFFFTFIKLRSCYWHSYKLGWTGKPVNLLHLETHQREAVDNCCVPVQFTWRLRGFSLFLVI